MQLDICGECIMETGLVLVGQAFREFSEGLMITSDDLMPFAVIFLVVEFAYALYLSYKWDI